MFQKGKRAMMVDTVMAYIENFDSDIVQALIPRIENLISERKRKRFFENGTSRQPFKFGKVELPPEIGLRIFEQLDYNSLNSCRQVSKSFFALASDPVLYKTLPAHMTQEGGLLYGANFSETLEFLRTVPFLERWEVEDDLNFGVKGVEKVAQTVPNLKCLNVAEMANLHADQINMLLRLLPIKELQLHSFIPIDFSSLTKLLLFGQTLPSIQSDSLQHIKASMTDDSIQELLEGCPNVSELYLEELIVDEPVVSACLRILEVWTVKVDFAFEHCRKLVVLHVGCQGDHVLSSPTVEVLRVFDDSPNDRDIEVELFPKLRELYIGYRTEPIICANLKVLELEESLHSESKLPNLKTLTVGNTSCKIPESVETLRISSMDENESLCELWGSVSLMPKLCTLDYVYCPPGPIQSATLTVLKIQRFRCRKDFEVTLELCPLLRSLHIFSPNPWSNDNPKDDNPFYDSPLVDVWSEFKSINTHLKIFVSLERARRMPSVFSDLLVEERVGYCNPDLFRVYY